jgi:hypothetical protein
MKRMWYLAMVALMWVAVQAVQAGDLWGGLRGGINIPRLSGGGNEVSRGYGSILAPNVGALAEYGLGDRLSVQFEINYVGQGGERKGRQPITDTPAELPQLSQGQYYYADFRSKSILNYLEVPVMLKCQWELSEHWGCFIEGGPYAGYLLNAKQKTSGSSQIYTDANGTPLTVSGQELPAQSFDADTNVKSDLNDWNVGLTAGVGLAYLVDASNQIFLDIRGEYGLINVQKDSANGSSKTGCAAILLGYKFNFGH